MKIFTAEQMKQAEAAANARGTSYQQLMENAGTAATKEIERLALSLPETPKSALLLCGKGNNAGDAFVVARLLANKGWNIHLLLCFGEQFSPLAQLNFSLLPPQVVVLQTSPVFEDYPIIVDGVLGTGFTGELTIQLQFIFEQANRTNAIRFALDIPSGLHCDTGAVSNHSFSATNTVTFGAYKPGLLSENGKKLAGEIICVDIGL